MRFRYTIIGLVLLAIVFVFWWMSEPSIVSYGPQESITDIDTPIEIVFDKSVEPDSVRHNLVISPSEDITWHWQDQTLRIVPRNGWNRNQSYCVRVGPKFSSKWGKTSNQVVEWQFEVKRPEYITMTLLGDVLFDELPDHFHSADDPHYPYNKLHPDLLREEDLVIANLECPISARGEEQKRKSYRFRAEPEAILMLQSGSIDAVTVANNHALDFGPIALADTATLCNEAGIEVVGLGPHGAKSVTPTIIEHEGYTIGLLAYLDKVIIPQHYRDLWEGEDGKPGVKFIDDDIVHEITKLKEEVDIVVVSLHWGLERMHTVTKEQRALAHQLIDAGADVIMGHHPHVPQGIERYENGIVFYSLGNFIFPPTDEHLRDTFAAKLRLGNGEFQDITLFPIKPVEGKPHAMTVEEAGELLKTVQAWSAQFNTEVVIDGVLGRVNAK